MLLKFWGEWMLANLVPRWKVETIYDIKPAVLRGQGIKGIITDLDNTLVGAGAAQATPELIEWLAAMEREGFKIVIVSNNNQLRVSRFSEPLKLPYIYRAKKPIKSAFRQALRTIGLPPAEVAMIGDQMLTDVLGGNRMGLYTILVKPIALGEEGLLTRLVNRKVERVALRLLHRKGVRTQEEQE